MLDLVKMSMKCGCGEIIGMVEMQSCGLSTTTFVERHCILLYMIEHVRRNCTSTVGAHQNIAFKISS